LTIIGYILNSEALLKSRFAFQSYLQKFHVDTAIPPFALKFKKSRSSFPANIIRSH